ncbi:hypothetical protein TCELL_1042 [Thermogladius calderae 1633]|uniref:Uncharacterized protein n=1 Tax=Thermogladius calderae (strain DSM 22663 / VKM B-2946 / 1633) TaxID=1184251 RepID=I3TFC7_THEC1|nr:hypothetical protein TCELL_1042 [Thermogladius calderae 1633]
MKAVLDEEILAELEESRSNQEELKGIGPSLLCAAFHTA